MKIAGTRPAIFFSKCETSGAGESAFDGRVNVVHALEYRLRCDSFAGLAVRWRARQARLLPSPHRAKPSRQENNQSMHALVLRVLIQVARVAMREDQALEEHAAVHEPAPQRLFAAGGEGLAERIQALALRAAEMTAKQFVV